MDYRKGMGSIFRQLRLDAGLTQKQLAKSVGVSDRTIRRWEKGIGIGGLHIDRLNQIANALHFTITLRFEEDKNDD